MKRAFARNLFHVIAVSLTLGSGLSGAWALECPAPQALGDGSAAQADLTGQLSSKDVLDQVPGMLGALRQQYPGANVGQFVNYLIAAYCPVVKADASLSEQEKQARIRDFADRVVSSAYSR